MFGTERKPVMMTFEESLPAPLIDVSGSVTYTGYSLKIGVATSEASWFLMRATVTGGLTFTDYANGSVNFDQVWDNRASLSYSR